MNISIPDDLRKRMDKANKTEDVNWSQVAAGAFEMKLAEIASRKVERTMDDVVQRLKASKLESSSKDEKEGKEAGFEWAKKHAEWPELVRLNKLWGDGNFDAIFNASNDSTSFFLETADPERMAECGGRDESDWTEEVFGVAGSISDEYVYAFWNGAVQIYNEVQDKV
jgi:hypothetical protein